MAEQTQNAIPLWGGIECTVHRLQNTYGDQLIRNGHWERISDLKLIAELGIKTVRYPLLWEKIAPQGIKKADWSWADERLACLQELGITPIAGLLHHGSGPRYTHLLDPDFPEKFTEFALAVAERYPWLRYFTPINEPLTTARFSCLYGHWYPHKRSSSAFAKALLLQCKATIMAMQAIRGPIPEAKLVQTEDLGKCHSTEKLAYQRDFENQRRWASFDLLCGKMGDNTLFSDYLLHAGKVAEAELAYFAETPCPPDIMGLNHYITSERYLDENLHAYPAWSHAGNGRHRYADVEVVRADIHQRAGHYQLLKEALNRYGLPLALTEVHLGASREEQLRWFMEAWEAVSRLKAEGADVRGITAWSLFGAYDWNTLITQPNNFYESGVFDVRTGTPRPTALAWLIRQLASGQYPSHPVLSAGGWWKVTNPHHLDLHYSSTPSARELPQVTAIERGVLLAPAAAPLLITGATGTLGRAFARICDIRNLAYTILNRQQLDITSAASIEAALQQHQPWAVVNAAGFVRVDDAEQHKEQCFLENTQGPVLLAEACRRYGTQLITFSSDLVFDGRQKTPYLESKPAAPLNVYGLSKFYAEQKVLSLHPDALIIRTSSFFGPWDEYNFITLMLRALEEQRVFTASSEHVVSPTYVPDLVHNSLDLLIDKASGIWHLTNPSEVSWADFALRTAEIAGLNRQLILPAKGSALGFRAPRPGYSALGSERGLLLPGLEDAIERYLREAETLSPV
ncbi:family 1 glycosylhydrolase [Cesiribacter andamanensis]|uniref:dTDP-4-dehydrorhamnose reductase n=1 Tax=Cesiribacter andamanensis AMV16 TaxID=1279009 RepID=M7N780_9BACT|nr:family 1 glycosylhydrolase [Cesiribacter andamanensis]EMR03127.1 dTDP-4-dehydrorhamnose reductase [Cesiribacter andamanensis AMV16]